MLRKLFWLIILFGAYIWVLTSGHDDMILEKGKEAYQALVSWFDGAEVDFQLKKSHTKKRSRRWD